MTHIKQDTAVECQNCDWRGTAGRVEMIDDIFARVAPGEPMPVGECPRCGALCHITCEDAPEKISVWVVSTCIPQPGEGPCFPSVFGTMNEAEAYATEMLRAEWEQHAPRFEDTNDPEPWPGDWREAQDIIIECVDDGSWGTWEITQHEVTVPRQRNVIEIDTAEADRGFTVRGVPPGVTLIHRHYPDIDEVKAMTDEDKAKLMQDEFGFHAMTIHGDPIPDRHDPERNGQSDDLPVGTIRETDDYELFQHDGMHRAMFALRRKSDDATTPWGTGTEGAEWAAWMAQLSDAEFDAEASEHEFS